MELANGSVNLYQKMDIKEKRELLSMLLLNSKLDAGIIDFKYKKPFDILVECGKSKIWLPTMDDVRTEIALGI